MNSRSEYIAAKLSRLFLSVTVFVAVSLCSGCIIVNHNFRTVESGQFYRSGQMRASQLGHFIQRYKIRTVINLRGASPQETWYRKEVAVCNAYGATHVDLAWAMNAIPPPQSLSDYVALCERAEKPILVHCQGGTHRAGVGSAVYLLVNGATISEADKQKGLLFHNAPIGGVLDLYANDGTAAKMSFPEWVRMRYPSLYRDQKLSPTY